MRPSNGRKCFVSITPAKRPWRSSETCPWPPWAFLLHRLSSLTGCPHRALRVAWLHHRQEMLLEEIHHRLLIASHPTLVSRPGQLPPRLVGDLHPHLVEPAEELCLPPWSPRKYPKIALISQCTTSICSKLFTKTQTKCWNFAIFSILAADRIIQ